jgi:alkyl sulfatase BDS1-like metallo-beta-lactamase superfamily hydrolase
MKRMNLPVLLFGLALTGALGTLLAVAVEPPEEDGKNAEPATAEANAALLKKLPFANRDDFADAKRGFIGTLPEVTIKDDKGSIVWSLKYYDFLAEGEPPPPTVNPSLWRIAQLNALSGLFQVTDRIYQVRGFDLSNMTIVEGDTGLIVIDALLSMETARAALDLYYAHRPKKPVVALIYTHAHVDHYGGVKGVISEEDVKAGKVQVLAPDGFMEHAVAENVLAGNAMVRRASYMFGAYLSKGKTGHIDTGLGKTTSFGTITLIAPTDVIKRTGETRTIDGIQIEFQMAPDTECPAEMLFYFPQFRALCAAEDMTHHLHNLYTLRGAPVRSGKAWWKAINETINLFADRTDVLFAQHHWPTWGQARITAYMKKQRDLYKYIHDQSLRLMNHGYTMLEIAEKLKLPPGLDNEWYNRSYYGTVSHNAKAVYQQYLGWYDGNPANLHALPPEDAARKYVEYMGGAAAVTARARADFKKGEFRWVAQVMNHVIFADPDNMEARGLAADALEQLGYQAESGPWRNVYLSGALELRHGIPKVANRTTATPDTIAAMPLEMFFDYLGVLLIAPKAEGKTIALNWNFTDTSEKIAATLENSALTYTLERELKKPDATLKLSRATLNEIMLKTLPFDRALATGKIKIQGDAFKVLEFFLLIDNFSPRFNLITP